MHLLSPAPARPSLKRLSGAATALVVTASLTLGAGALPASAAPSETAAEAPAASGGVTDSAPAEAVAGADRAAPAAAAPETAVPAAAFKNRQQVIDVFNGVNKFRKSKGLPALRIGLAESTVAQEETDKMALTQVLKHSGAYASDPRIQGWNHAAENIAYAGSAQGLVEAWISSPPHNAGMSRREDQVMGVGVSIDRFGSTWGTTTFYSYFDAPQKTYATAEEYLAAPVFSDVPDSSQFAGEIKWMKDRKISTGYTDGTYRPLDNVNRDAMAAFMHRLLGSPVVPAHTGAWPFKDVSSTQQFADQMRWVHGIGVSTGWSDGTYRPLTPVNRDAMAAFMYRLAGSPKFTPPTKSPFRDVSTSNQFYKEISWLAAEGISTGWDWGYGVKKFEPAQPVKRDAMAAFMYRFAQNGYPVTK